jgi:phosphomannomutase/phosphoglucomutase
LRGNGATTEYWKTGHSYIKRRVAELGAIAGFEKSGHFFFNPPIGRGYDDGIVTAIAVCQMLDRNAGKTMADLYRDLPVTYGSPTMSAHCADNLKYDVAKRVLSDLTAVMNNGDTFAGQGIADLVTVNGVRLVAEDGTWGLVRASSNKPEMVVVVESPVSSARRGEMFDAIDAVLRRSPEVGPYNQTF